MKFRLLAATALVVATSAYAADNMTVKDGTGATKVLAKKDVGSVLYDKNIVVLQSDVTIDAMAQIDGHVDGIESLLTTETANTSAISGKLPATLGSKTGATSLSVVPANDGFSVQCTSGCSGGTQYNEDVASANGDTGTIALAVRKATPANTSGTDGDYEALQISAGRLWTDAGALLPTSLGAKVGTGSLSVVPASDGFGVNASQTGTWNITNISGTVSLPTGAATAAKQPALGTAGSSSADVITVQGITGGTNLNVNCAAGCAGGTSYTEDVVAAADPVGLAVISRRRDTMTTSEVSADGDNIGLISTNKGELRINDASVNTVLGTTSDSAWASGAGSAISLLKTIATASLDTTPATVNLTQVAGSSISQGNGTAATAIRVALPTDGTGVVGLNAGTAIIGKVGIDQTTDGTTNLVAAKQSGTWNVTNISGTVSLPTGAATAAKQPALGTAGTASADVISVQGVASMTPIQTRSAGTATPVRIASAAASTNLTEIADSGGCRIVSIAGAVARTSAVYLKLYNAADGSVTVGTTTPYITLPLPAGGTNPTSFQFDVNQVFASGACSLAMTTAVADNSTAALTAADVVGLTVIWGTN